MIDMPPPGEGSTLRLARRLEAQPSEVFEAFTRPELLREWWGPRGFTFETLDFPAREGGEYRVSLRGPDGTRFAHTGVFLRVAPPSELVYTWRWTEGPLGRGETLVELSFEPDHGGTLLKLRHSRFASDAERDRHGGWADALERLPEFLRASRARTGSLPG